MKAMFETSFSGDGTIIEISDKIILIKNLPSIFEHRRLLIFLTDCQGREYNKIVVDFSRIVRFPILYVPSGTYFINVYFEGGEKSFFQSYLYNRDLPISICGNNITFFLSRVFETNKLFFINSITGHEKLKQFLQPSNIVQSDNKEIVDLTQKVIHQCVNNYNKVLAIHDWVADNIYYDNDALKEHNYDKLYHSALNTYYRKRSVCQGYSNLAVAMCRSIGIPAVGMLCYSLDFSSDGGWEKEENMFGKPNHIITYAYVDNRWIMFDPTWDSDNVYENASYHRKKMIGVSHKYFDVTLAFISNSHRFCETVVY